MTNHLAPPIACAMALWALATPLFLSANTLEESPKKTANPTPSPSPFPSPAKPAATSAQTPRQAQTRIFVGREIPVPTRYSAPQVSTTSSGGYVIQPSVPVAFEVRKTGVTVDTTKGIKQTELEGFIDYGTPIRTIVPVYNDKGEFIGTTIQEHPNPVLQPVFRTITR